MDLFFQPSKKEEFKKKAQQDFVRKAPPIGKAVGLQYTLRLINNTNRANRKKKSCSLNRNKGEDCLISPKSIHSKDSIPFFSSCTLFCSTKEIRKLFSE